MKVSVVIPTYNDAATLPQTVEAVLAQDGSVPQVIVVNDAGAPPALLPPGVTLLEQPQNAGPGPARNRGFQAATGDLIYFLDADDLPAPGLLQTACHLFAADPEMNILVTGLTATKEATSGSPIAPPPPLPAPAALPPLELLDHDVFARAFGAAHNDFLPSNTLIRRSFLETLFGSTGPFREDIRYGEDTLYFLEMMAATPAHRLALPGVTYRVRADSYSRGVPIKVWQGRIAACQAALASAEGAPGAQAMHHWAWRLRQNAARRVARLLAAEGQKTEARALMARYLWRPFDPKMLAALLRLGF